MSLWLKVKSLGIELRLKGRRAWWRLTWVGNGIVGFQLARSVEAIVWIRRSSASLQTDAYLMSITTFGTLLVGAAFLTDIASPWAHET